MSELSEASLEALLVELGKHMDETSDRISLIPKYLIARPSDLEALGLTVDDVKKMIKGQNNGGLLDGNRRRPLYNTEQRKHMTQDELKVLIEDLRLNHEFCPKEIILQAADELERMQQGIETLHAMYEQVSRQRDELMDAQRSMVAAMRGRIQ